MPLSKITGHGDFTTGSSLPALLRLYKYFKLKTSLKCLINLPNSVIWIIRFSVLLTFFVPSSPRKNKLVDLLSLSSYPSLCFLL